MHSLITISWKVWEWNIPIAIYYVKKEMFLSINTDFYHAIIIDFLHKL